MRNNRACKVILAAILLLSLLTAGMFSAMAEEKPTLKIMVWGQTSTMENGIKALLTAHPELGDKFDTEIVVGGTGDNDVAQEIRRSLVSGVPCADIVQLNYTQIAEFAEAGVLEDLSPIVTPVWDDLLGAAQVLCQYKGSIIASPLNINQKIFYYRADLFEQAGVDPTTWKTVDDMIAGGKAVQEKFPEACILNYSKAAGAQGYDVYMMFTAYEAQFVDENGEYILDKDPGVRKAFETLKKIIDSGICYDANDFGNGWDYGLANSQIVSEMTANWFRMFAPMYVPDQAGKWAACQWPEEIRKGSDAGGSVLVIPSFCEHKEEAMAFLANFRLDAATSGESFWANGSVPILSSVFADITGRAEHPFIAPNTQGESYWEVEYKTFNNGAYSIFPYTPKAAAEMDIVNSYATKYFTGTMELDAMLSALNADLTMQIGNPFD